ncbi:unnamed protein product [Calicophoron daubneyi]|uniref:GDP-fucose protein O-fucosyltransferase 2 n=1 Tax=Calicophoron daubneyi TaxID=300641 RepID=A0AAV2TV43_CALDB
MIVITDEKTESLDLNWTLVLPPWGPLPHWYGASQKTGWSLPEHNSTGVQWSTFFDVDSLARVIPVIEFSDFYKTVLEKDLSHDHGGLVIDMAFKLYRDFDPSRAGSRRGIEYCPDEIRGLFQGSADMEDQPIELVQAFTTREFELKTVGFRSMNYDCITGDLEPIYLAQFLRRLFRDEVRLNSTRPYRAVYLVGAEAIIHGHWSEWSQEYWTVRRSMVFSEKLIESAHLFEGMHLYPSRRFRPIKRPVNVPALGSGSAWLNRDWPQTPPLGGPYIAVHWRCGDYLSQSEDIWRATPSPLIAAQQINASFDLAENVFGVNTIDNIFLATDASDEHVLRLVEYLKPHSVVRHRPTESQWQLFGPGGLAIIDQIICSHASFFVGTNPSTFTFRITEERSIMGFPPESTFNTLCAKDDAKFYSSAPKSEGSEECEELTAWPVVYEPAFTLNTSQKTKSEQSDSHRSDEL